MIRQVLQSNNIFINVAERAVRSLAIGHKNWLFVVNEGGGEAAAIILSLAQSWRALNINPREYLENIMRKLMSHSVNKLYELIPDQWPKARLSQTSCPFFLPNKKTGFFRSI